MPPPLPALPAVRIVGTRKFGSGHQYQVEWSDQSTTWEAASKARKEHPALVQAYDQQLAQHASGNGVARSVAPADSTGADAGVRSQMAMLEQLVRDQAEQMRAQAAQLAQLHASPQHSPQSSAQPSPQLSPMGGSAIPVDAAASLSLGAPTVTVTALAQQQQSRFAKKEPRAQDLKEYDGAAGGKLDEWLQDLDKIAAFFHLNDIETVEFGALRLSSAAYQWWRNTDKQTIRGAAEFGAALRARFQPVTTKRAAREQLRQLRQGARGINDYIADFQRLHALLPDMSAEDALFAFEMGVHPSLALEIRKQASSSLQDAIALAARIGGLTAASSSSSIAPAQGRAAARQMEMGDDDEPSLDERIQRAVLNAMQSSTGSGSAGFGLGAKTQTQRGHASERGGGGQRGRGRGVRFGGAQRSVPVVPGVSEEVVRRRLDAQQCVRCGEEGHRSPACPNAISASGK